VEGKVLFGVLFAINSLAFEAPEKKPEGILDLFLPLL
jgi:hypothetical protein